MQQRRNKAQRKDNPLGLLALADSIECVRYTDTQWGAVERVVHQRLDADANAITLAWPPSEPPIFDVSLRDALEVELWGFRFDSQFRMQHPMLTRAQIRKALLQSKTAARRLTTRLDNPALAAYGPDPRPLRIAIVEYLRQLDHVDKDIAAGAELPGVAAPKDGAIGEGWQREYQTLSRDPTEKLIGHMRAIYARAFRRKPGVADDGPAAEFIRAAVRPIANLNSVRRALEKHARAERH